MQIMYKKFTSKANNFIANESSRKRRVVVCVYFKSKDDILHDFLSHHFQILHPPLAIPASNRSEHKSQSLHDIRQNCFRFIQFFVNFSSFLLSAIIRPSSESEWKNKLLFEKNVYILCNNILRVIYVVVLVRATDGSSWKGGKSTAKRAIDHSRQRRFRMNIKWRRNSSWRKRKSWQT